MKETLKKKNVPFTQVSNSLLQNPNLSLKAKGLYSYLYSKPDKWDFSSNRIAQEMKDGRDAIRSAMRELEQHGYINRKKEKTGRITYFLYLDPKTGNPSEAMEPKTENPTDGKSHRGKIRPISNKDTYSNKEDNKYITEQSSGDYLNKEVLPLFEVLNPNYELFYKRPPQRAAAKRLVDKIGLEKLKNSIEFAAYANNQQYAPTITTPVQMENKLAQLVAFYRRQGSKDNLVVSV